MSHIALIGPTLKTHAVSCPFCLRASSIGNLIKDKGHRAGCTGFYTSFSNTSFSNGQYWGTLDPSIAREVLYASLCLKHTAALKDRTWYLPVVKSCETNAQQTAISLPLGGDTLVSCTTPVYVTAQASTSLPARDNVYATNAPAGVVQPPRPAGRPAVPPQLLPLPGYRQSQNLQNTRPAAAPQRVLDQTTYDTLAREVRDSSASTRGNRGRGRGRERGRGHGRGI